ncbi:arylsulfatase [Humisphaera borealis]|uniref:Arylsulfatase n=1 Tax=Humisphaera borealis TaxID=2807512 RepID=A0A7M2WYJ2_9BACT|nr:arylsulfatase [Humisphaera borealis]QOV90558.1 arylsulfatase [Humisphaera borealis]
MLRTACAVVCVLTAVVFTWPSDAAETSPARPNVVIILADDLGYSDVGCYGGEIETPNLDKLAANGVRFTSFYNTARCWPTRSAILSGYYPQQIGMDPQTGTFPAWTKLLPQRLTPLGYHSYHSGKWHVNNAPRIVADGGFEHSYNLADQGRYFSPKNHLLDDKPLPAVARDSGYYATTAIADHAIDFLKEHAQKHKAEPFFSYVAFTAPHFPIQALPEDIARYRERYRKGWDVLRAERYERQQKMGISTCALSKPEPQIIAPSGKASDLDIYGPAELRYAANWNDLTPEQKEFQATKFAIHAAMIDRMDREIGRVLDQIRAMSAMENTIIFFLSDNGASAEVMIRADGHDPAAPMGSAATHLCLGPGGSTVSNTPFRRHKIWVHEGGISTPLIVHWPKGIAARGEVRHAVGHVIDLVPTILTLAGGQAEGPTGAPPLPGRSLLPALAKDVPIERDYLYFSHVGNRALRVGDYKVVSAVVDDNRWELYNIATDRNEEKDLAAAEPDRLKQMVAKWEAVNTGYLAEYSKAVPNPVRKRGKGKEE